MGNPIADESNIMGQNHQQLEWKISDLEDRSWQNNLWFSGFNAKAEGSKTSEESQTLIWEFIEET